MLWERLSAVFFSPGVSRLQIRLPDGSRGWDTSAAYAGGDSTKRAAEELAFRALRAFRQILPPGEPLYVCELPGTGWYFDPRADITDATRASWAVTVLAEVDPVFFVTQDLRLGLISHYPYKTLHVFGAELIEAFGAELSTGLAELP